MTFDPGAIAEQLAQAQEARTRLDRVIAWLQEGVELFSDDRPPPALPAAVAPAVKKPKPARAPATGLRDAEAKILHAILNASQPLSRSEIADATGLSPGSLKHSLSKLVKTERLAMEGTRATARYRAAERAPHSEHRARTEAGKQRNGVDFDSGVARVRLRDQCMKAIAADPDALTEERLAQALDAPRDAIAEACGWLLMRERIALNSDGTYRRAGTQEMAA